MKRIVGLALILAAVQSLPLSAFAQGDKAEQRWYKCTLVLTRQGEQLLKEAKVRASGSPLTVTDNGVEFSMFRTDKPNPGLIAVTHSSLTASSEDKQAKVTLNMSATGSAYTQLSEIDMLVTIDGASARFTTNVNIDGSAPSIEATIPTFSMAKGLQNVTLKLACE